MWGLDVGNTHFTYEGYKLHLSIMSQSLSLSSFWNSALLVYLLMVLMILGIALKKGFLLGFVQRMEDLAQFSLGLKSLIIRMLLICGDKCRENSLRMGLMLQH